MSAVEARLAELGLTLPAVVPPLARTSRPCGRGCTCTPRASCPWWTETSGHRKVGAEVTPEEAKQLARTCALNALAAVKSVAGDLDRVARVVKVVGFVASAPDFTGSPGSSTARANSWARYSATRACTPAAR